MLGGPRTFRPEGESRGNDRSGIRLAGLSLKRCAEGCLPVCEALRELWWATGERAAIEAARICRDGGWKGARGVLGRQQRLCGARQMRDGGS